MELGKDGLPLEGAIDGGAKQAVCAVGDGRLHGLADGLCNEHPFAQAKFFRN